VAGTLAEQQVEDVAVLARCPLLSALPLDEIGQLLERLTLVTLSEGATLGARDDDEPALHFVLQGALGVVDGSERKLGAGDVLGAMALVGLADGERARALGDVRLAKLSLGAYSALCASHPRAAFHLAHGALRMVSERLRDVERRLAPPSAAVHAVDPGPRSARVEERLPRELAGVPVVAGREGERLLALDATVADSAVLTPVTTADWEGRDVYRRSAGLVLLEAARQLGIELSLGPSLTSGRLVLTTTTLDRTELARRLDTRLTELCRTATPILEELWSVPDAVRRFREQGDPNAALLLEDSLEPVTTLVRCGKTYAAVPRPLLPHAGLLDDVHVLEHPLGLLLDFGSRIRRTLPARKASTLALELHAPRYGAAMTRSASAWLRQLGIESVGTFNRACIEGRAADLIRVSEGFHEKGLAEIADQIARREGVRVVAVAGPSSSGKTTFIKRLLVQLRVNGFEPLELSLDDYYADRERLVPDAHGELDLERLDALDLTRFRADLGSLLEGEAVRPPRYDFPSGKSLPRAGTELRLGARNVLLVEGIHALNPELYGPFSRGRAFGVFVHPATTLAFDRLSTLEPADVRLLRRIVRDRHQRGFATAETLARWPSVRRAERLHIFPFQGEADAVFDTSLIYEVSVLRVYAERYLLEVPRSAPEAASARRLRELLRSFVPIHPDHVPSTSLLREFIGGSGFSA
jgi:uridine kinase